MHRYIKIPLITGTFQMLAHTILYWTELGVSVALFRESANGFVLGSVMGLVLVFIHSQFVKRMSKRDSEEAFDVHQKRAFLLHLPYEQAFELCKESLDFAGGNSIKEEDRDSGKIVAHTKPTLNYWAHDIVSYNVQKIGERLTQVEISSGPKGRTPLIDNGRNLKRIETLGQFLTSNDSALDIRAVSDKLNGGSRVPGSSAGQGPT